MAIKEDYNKAECYVLHKDLSLRTEMRIALSEINVKCREFAKWQEVAAVLQMDTPSFMILSVDGDCEPAIKLLPKIRIGELGRNPFMPIAALTYFTDPEYHLRLIEASFNSHLQGPFSNRQLKDCVKFLSEDRRLYIANTDYIGPEFSDVNQEDRNAELSNPIPVPNSLSDHKNGIKTDFQAMDETLTMVLNERVRDAGFNTLKSVNETITNTALDARQVAGKLAATCHNAKKLVNADRFPHSRLIFDTSEQFCAMVAKRGYEGEQDREMSNRLVDLMELLVKDTGDPEAMIAETEKVHEYIRTTS